MNIIHNEDCIKTMQKMGKVVDVVLTSPPYNMTYRTGGKSDCPNKRYDKYRDWRPVDEYVDWTVSLFEGFHKVLKRNGCVLYNFSYSIENPALPYLIMAAIHNRTPFTVVDTIIWKKKVSVPFTSSSNRLRRICEFVIVLARKSERRVFNCNKKIIKVSTKGQNYYENIDNFIIARNNDGATKLNRATYSSDLCKKLLKIYAKKGDVIYDPFMGTGTTAVAAKQMDMNYIGSEISENQVEYARNRIEKYVCENTQNE